MASPSESSENYPSQSQSSTDAQTANMVAPPTMSAIVEDDQQLYDWGIENRMEQYHYQDQQGQYHQAGYVPNNPDVVVTQHPQQELHPPYGHPQHQTFVQPHLAPHPAKREYNEESSRETTTLPPAPPMSELVASPVKREVVHQVPEPCVKATRQQGSRAGRRPALPQVDMDANELLKIERKRARNRVAASKCRLRKLERIAVLDNQASQLRSENEELASLADKLRAQVYSLKQELRWHINNGCKVYQGGQGAGLGQHHQQTASPDSTTTASSNHARHSSGSSNSEDHKSNKGFVAEGAAAS